LAEAKNGWFIGQFVPESEMFRHQNDFELKWGRHPKGEKRTSFAQYKTATTISILLSGVFFTRIKVDAGFTEVTLRAPGEYIAFGPGVPHSWEAIEDCDVLSIRFPSLAADQVEMPTPV
jgi:hypothetical protein